MNKIEKQVLAVYSRVNPSLISVKNDPNLKLFFKKRQNESGVREDGGVLIRSLTRKVCSAIISARLIAIFAG